ncbi:hypothetical protein ACFW04_012182 [Cataglyphis niger]
MSEIWLVRKGWDRSKGYLPKRFRWEVQLAERKNKKGRAMGGMLLGIRKGLKVEEVKTKKTEGLMEVVLKIYASVLASKLSDEVEKKGLVPQNQTCFRKMLGIMDNIFILNYLVNRQLEKKKGKLVAFFMDLKTAFDSVDRRKLVEAMREKGMREGLVRSEDILRKTGNREERGAFGIKTVLDRKGNKAGMPIELSLI